MMISEERGEDGELERDGVGLYCCWCRNREGSGVTERRGELEASRSEREGGVAI